MIDTDKYEGHTIGKWRVRTRKGTFTVKDCLGDEVATVNDYADARLIAVAPLLLEEVKRLQKENKILAKYMDIVQKYDDALLADGDTDPRWSELYE